MARSPKDLYSEMAETVAALSLSTPSREQLQLVAQAVGAYSHLPQISESVAREIGLLTLDPSTMEALREQTLGFGRAAEEMFRELQLTNTAAMRDLAGNRLLLKEVVGMGSLAALRGGLEASAADAATLYETLQEQLLGFGRAATETLRQVQEEAARLAAAAPALDWIMRAVPETYGGLFRAEALAPALRLDMARTSSGLIEAYHDLRRDGPAEPSWQPSREVAFHVRSVNILAGEDEPEGFEGFREEARAETEDGLPQVLERLDPAFASHLLKIRDAYARRDPLSFLVGLRILIDELARRLRPRPRRLSLALRLQSLFAGRPEWPFLAQDLAGGRSLLQCLNAGAHEMNPRLSPLDITDIRLRGELLVLTLIRVYWPGLLTDEN